MPTPVWMWLQSKTNESSEQPEFIKSYLDCMSKSVKPSETDKYTDSSRLKDPDVRRFSSDAIGAECWTECSLAPNRRRKPRTLQKTGVPDEDDTFQVWDECINYWRPTVRHLMTLSEETCSYQSLWKNGAGKVERPRWGRTAKKLNLEKRLLFLVFVDPRTESSKAANVEQWVTRLKAQNVPAATNPITAGLQARFVSWTFKKLKTIKCDEGWEGQELSLHLTSFLRRSESVNSSRRCSECYDEGLPCFLFNLA